MKKKSKKKLKKTEKSLLEKAKGFVSTADDAVEKKVKQVRKSKAFKDATGTLKKIEGFAEDKIGEFKKSGTKKKLDKALAKAEKKAAKTLKKAEKALKKAKKLGSEMATKAEVRLSELTGKPKRKSKARVTAPKVRAGRPKAVKIAGAEVKPVVAEVKAKPKTVKPVARKVKSAVEEVKAKPRVTKPVAKEVKPVVAEVKVKPKAVKRVTTKPRASKPKPPAAEPPAEPVKEA
jgi:hypothetical protein